MNAGREALRRRVCAAVDAHARELIAFSHELHDHPETAYREHRAAAALADRLRRGGLAVTAPAYRLPTAVAGHAGSHGPRVVICCEYDALPGLGHACGHNVVAAAGLGAGLALAPLAAAIGGRITVLGTPAEEGGGGKILMAGRGAFDDAAAAMLVHPGPYETVRPHISAMTGLQAVLLGRPAHASMFPELGVNALDALVLGYLGVSALRQHLSGTERVHGVIRDGGRTPSVVPSRASAVFLARAATIEQAHALRQRVIACLEGGAHAVGARLAVRTLWPEYREMWHNLPLAAAFTANLHRLGRSPLPPEQVPASRSGSTDLGDVSQLVPAVHPKLAISPPNIAQHTPEFARWAIAPTADRAVLDGAKALALTAVDIWLDARLRAAMHTAFGPEPASAPDPGPVGAFGPGLVSAFGPGPVDDFMPGPVGVFASASVSPSPRPLTVPPGRRAIPRGAVAAPAP
ncbi:amidohydrolase [Actinoplanes sp. L3-i22]|uniref:amidohydrolase n=1 Tax=Actinoplanes sp. L3-i22 TaxID=2836373 RepID=UPI001C7426C8|nr:amidohydrolase [Actinoplanes sp. L3-i22]BCY07372.1 peptidase M20 [Actinoplanes sp. L3-i22]